jgi:uncharacterized protein (DUF885 family)
MRRWLALSTLALALPVRGSETVAALGRDFFAWRHVTQPVTSDDVARPERPADWVPDVSPNALRKQREKLAEFQRRLTAAEPAAGTPGEVDALLLRSAIARADFELNILAAPWRNPDFYVHQTLGSVFEALLRPPPFTRERVRHVLALLKAIPGALRHVETNLQEPIEPFAESALARLKDIRPRLTAVAEALKQEFPASSHKELESATRNAAEALENYARWLETNRARMKKDFALGRDLYQRLLRRVALLPYTPEQLVAIAEVEWNRVAAFDAYEINRTRDASPPQLAPSAEAQIDQMRKDEASVRDFLRDRGILDVPDWVGHYRNRVLPAYLAPLGDLGVADDLTSPSRRGEGAVSYIRPPSADLPFFAAASARDPRPILVHEGVPGHFLQLTLAWAHPDPLRHEYFDSGPIEGIGFYAEEMMLQHGYFDDRPRTREILYKFARLRALRVTADVRLATGAFTIEAAAKFLQEHAPMDRGTALQEARFFASTPGQAISYQIGKYQVFKFLADARRVQGDSFRLRDFHNRLWREGNVPVALQRWEYLGLEDEIAELRKN